MDAILEFFSQLFSGFGWLAVFLVAMLPIAEAKVAIPFGISQEIWGETALPPVWAAVIAFFGSMIPAFFIIPFLKPVFEKLKQSNGFHKLVVFLENLFVSKAKKQEYRMEVQMLKHGQQPKTELLNKEIAVKLKVSTNGKRKPKPKLSKQSVSKLWQMVTLVFFVALPLPLAGVWTSSAIAAFGKMKYSSSLLAIAVGNLFEVVFVTLLCVVFYNSIGVVLVLTILLIVAYATIMIVLHNRKNARMVKNNCTLS